jgi:hypothetical protein
VFVIGLPIFFVLWTLSPDPVTTTTLQTSDTGGIVTTVPQATDPTFVLPVTDITAQRMTSPPEINADGFDWADIWPMESLFEVYLVGPNNGFPSGVWWVGWDDESLYVFVRVADPVFMQFWVDRPDQLWQGDSVSFEFGSDPTSLDATSGLRSADVHVLLGPRSLGLEPAITAVNRVSGNGNIVAGPDPDIEAWADATDDAGYDMEARIPWAELGVTNPEMGDVFAMNLNVSDVGDNGELRSMVSNNPDRTAEVQNLPGRWTTLVLGP